MRVGNVEKPTELYEKASELLRQTKNLARAKEVKEKTALLYEEAGIKAQKFGEFQRAADYFEGAADLWRKIGNKSKARIAEEKALEAYAKTNY